MGEKKRTLRGFLCAALGGVCWGASGTVGQYLFTCQGVDSGWLTVVRMFLAGVVLLGGALVRHRPQLRAIWSDRRDALRLVLFSVGGLMTCQYTYLAAIRYSNSATATVLQYMGQALILLWVCLRARRLPTRREGAALVLALLGAFLLATHGSLTALALSPQALFWGLCAAVSLMLYTLLPGDLLRRYPVSVCTGCGMFIGGVVLLVLTQAWRIPVALNAAVALGTLEISVVGTALAFTLYLQGVSDVGGVRASLLACTEPVSAALCAALWLHTSFAWQDLLGFAAILVMAVLIALPERASEKIDGEGGELKKERAENREATVSGSHFLAVCRTQSSSISTGVTTKQARVEIAAPCAASCSSAPYSAAATTVCVTTGMASSTTYTLRTSPPMPSSAQRAAPSAGEMTKRKTIITPSVGVRRRLRSPISWMMQPVSSSAKGVTVLLMYFA